VETEEQDIERQPKKRKFSELEIELKKKAEYFERKFKEAEKEKKIT
jgi:hypothetical protein